MIDIVEIRVSELETLFEQIKTANIQDDHELYKAASRALGNISVAQKNLDVGIKILKACGKRR